MASRSRALRSGGSRRIARVEVADVDVDQVHVVDADVGGDRQPFLLGAPHEFDAGRRRQAADVHPRAAGALQFEDRLQRHRLRHDRDRRQPEPPGHRAGRGDAGAGERVLDRPQPERQVEGLRVAHRLQQHAVVVRQAARLHERDAAGLVQRLDLGERLALQPGGQRAERVRAGAGRTRATSAAASGRGPARRAEDRCPADRRRR